MTAIIIKQYHSKMLNYFLLNSCFKGSYFPDLVGMQHPKTTGIDGNIRGGAERQRKSFMDNKSWMEADTQDKYILLLRNLFFLRFRACDICTTVYSYIQYNNTTRLDIIMYIFDFVYASHGKSCLQRVLHSRKI